MTTPAWVRLDDDDPRLPEYLLQPISRRWTREVGSRAPLAAVYNEAFQWTPDAAWYGFIADDVVPETFGWDAELIDLAGPDGMAVPNGGHGGTPHFVLGGDLVRSVGWLALPGLDRIYIDTVWADIARGRGVLRYLPDVVLRHHHFSNRMALRDPTYRKTRKAEDAAIYETWKRETRSSP